MQPKEGQGGKDERRRLNAKEGGEKGSFQREGGTRGISRRGRQRKRGRERFGERVNRGTERYIVPKNMEAEEAGLPFSSAQTHAASRRLHCGL